MSKPIEGAFDADTWYTMVLFFFVGLLKGAIGFFVRPAHGAVQAVWSIAAGFKNLFGGGSIGETQQGRQQVASYHNRVRNPRSGSLTSRQNRIWAISSLLTFGPAVLVLSGLCRAAPPCTGTVPRMATAWATRRGTTPQTRGAPAHDRHTIICLAALKTTFNMRQGVEAPMHA